MNQIRTSHVLKSFLYISFDYSFREKVFGGTYGWSIGFTVTNILSTFCVSAWDTEVKDLRFFSPDDHIQFSLKWGCGFFKWWNEQGRTSAMHRTITMRTQGKIWCTGYWVASIHHLGGQQQGCLLGWRRIDLLQRRWDWGPQLQRKRDWGPQLQIDT